MPKVWYACWRNPPALTHSYWQTFRYMGTWWFPHFGFELCPHLFFFPNSYKWKLSQCGHTQRLYDSGCKGWNLNRADSRKTVGSQGANLKRYGRIRQLLFVFPMPACIFRKSRAARLIRSSTDTTQQTETQIHSEKICLWFCFNLPSPETAQRCRF